MKITNTIASDFNASENFPDSNFPAYEKSGNTILFNSISNKNFFSINTDTHILKTLNEPTDLIDFYLKINDFTYFLPSKYSETLEYANSPSSDAVGNFERLASFNSLGFPVVIKMDFPKDKKIYEFSYNKYGQVLKINEVKLVDKVKLKNEYDEKSRIISQEKNYEELKSKREFIYGENDKIFKENIKEKRIAPNGRIISDTNYTFNYEYNKLGQIIKKSTNDQNFVEQYQYDSTGRIVSFIKYFGEIDKDDSNKLINHFIKKTYTYIKDQVAEEKQFEYNIINTSVLVDKKWQPINVEQQRKLAWEMLINPSQMPLSEIEKKYIYTSNEINVTVTKFSFSNRMENDKTKQERNILASEKIKFLLNNNGRIIKKETKRENQTTDVIEEYFY